MFISICIPAYKNLQFLERLLYSIQIQTFKDFEVVITDDSSDNEIEDFFSEYKASFPIKYIKNNVALGTPDNWNEAIRNAKGEWIKIIHDDDWFMNENSLEKFAAYAKSNPNGFIFSAYQNMYLDDDRTEIVLESSSSLRFKQLKKNVASLLSKNIIGPPSVVMHKNDGKSIYDKQLKWLVDIDFYVERMKYDIPVYSKEPLMNVGLSNEQVTKSCFRIAEVEIPEYFHFMNKIGWKNMNNIFVYDASWRLMRNLRIKNISQIQYSGYNGIIHKSIISIVQFQSLFSHRLLKIGFVSKLLMVLNYFYNYIKNKF